MKLEQSRKRACEQGSKGCRSTYIRCLVCLVGLMEAKWASSRLHFNILFIHSRTHKNLNSNKDNELNTSIQCLAFVGDKLCCTWNEWFVWLLFVYVCVCVRECASKHGYANAETCESQFHHRWKIKSSFYAWILFAPLFSFTRSADLFLL